MSFRLPAARSRRSRMAGESFRSRSLLRLRSHAWGAHAKAHLPTGAGSDESGKAYLPARSVTAVGPALLAGRPLRVSNGGDGGPPLGRGYRAVPVAVLRVLWLGQVRAVPLVTGA